MYFILKFVNNLGQRSAKLWPLGQGWSEVLKTFLQKKQQNKFHVITFDTNKWISEMKLSTISNI